MKKEYIKISLKRMFLSKNKNRKKVILFDSSLDTFNIGDHIIMSYCNKIMNQIFADKKKTHNISWYTIGRGYKRFGYI